MLQQVHALVRVIAADEERLPESFEAVEHAQHPDHPEGWPQVRQGDLPKLLPGVCAVHRSGLIQVGPDAVKPGQPEDHVVAGVFPHIGQHQHPERRAAAHPVNGRRPQCAKPGVHQPVFGKQRLPQHHNARHRDRHWQQEACAEHPAAGGFAAVPPAGHHPHPKRQQQAHGQQDRHTAAQKPRGVARRQLKSRVLQHGAVVGKPGKPPACIAEAAAHGFGKGQQHKHRGAQQARQQEQRGGPAFGVGLAAPAWGFARRAHLTAFRQTAAPGRPARRRLPRPASPHP